MNPLFRVGTALAIALASFAAQAQIPDNLVKIGVLTDMSAGQADSTGPGSVMAAKMAAEDFGGKVLGKPIEVIVADQQGKPDVSAQIVRKWLELEQVDVVADVTLSSIAFVVQNLTRERNRIYLGSTAGSSDLTGPACSPNAVHWTYDTYSLANGIAAPMVANGADTWYFITADYAFGHALARDTKDAIARAGGKTIGEVKYPIGMPDFSS
jgi:branched-chain amino acid transport system substrate-binding protein